MDLKELPSNHRLLNKRKDNASGNDLMVQALWSVHWRVISLLMVRSNHTMDNGSSAWAESLRTEPSLPSCGPEIAPLSRERDPGSAVAHLWLYHPFSLVFNNCCENVRAKVPLEAKSQDLITPSSQSIFFPFSLSLLLIANKKAINLIKEK